MTYEQLRQVLEAEERPPTMVFLPNSSRTVAVPTVRRHETRWTDARPDDFGAVPNKPALALGDRCWYPEFILVRLLERAGWSAVWVKNWPRRKRAFWVDINTPMALPPEMVTLVTDLDRGLSPDGGGCWDVMAWRGSETMFVESKKPPRDTLTPNQKTWLESALAQGVPLSSFLIAEYSVPPETRAATV